MKKWIRLPGLIAFLGITAVIVIFALFFADNIVKGTIESMGTKLVGAKVELADVALSFIPAGMELSGIQVTNPDEPMKNAVQIARANFSMDTLNLFRRKVIIEEMALEGVQLNTQRKKSGAVTSAKKQKKDTEPADTGKSKLPSFEIPDVKDILKKESLLAIDEIDNFKKEIEQEKERFKKELDALPDKEKLESYRKRIKDLKAGSSGLAGILQTAKEAKDIKKDLKKDIKQIKKVKKEFKSSLQNMRKKFKDVSSSPLRDVKRIKDKYTLSPEGLGNLTGLILDPKYNAWLKTAINWYVKLKPKFEKQLAADKKTEVSKPARGKGLDVKFKEHTPTPDFLIKKVNALLELPAGTISGKINNITPDQHITGIPITCEFTGKKLNKMNDINIDGTFDHIRPDKPKDVLAAKINGYKIDNISISDNPEIPILLESAALNITFDGEIQNSNIDSDVNIKFTSANFSSAKQEKPNRIGNAVQAALKKVSNFSIQADILGTLDNYDISITSDLDNVMKNAVSELVNQMASEFEAKLKEEILAKTDGKINALNENMNGLNGIDSELTNRINLGEDLTSNVGSFL